MNSWYSVMRLLVSFEDDPNFRLQRFNFSSMIWLKRYFPVRFWAAAIRGHLRVFEKVTDPLLVWVFKPTWQTWQQAADESWCFSSPSPPDGPIGPDSSLEAGIKVQRLEDELDFCRLHNYRCYATGLASSFTRWVRHRKTCERILASFHPLLPAKAGEFTHKQPRLQQ